MLEVRLCKPAIYKLKILGRGKFEYYKSMGGTTKTRDQIYKVQWGEAKGGGGGTLFDITLVLGEPWGETMFMKNIFLRWHLAPGPVLFSLKLLRKNKLQKFVHMSNFAVQLEESCKKIHSQKVVNVQPAVTEWHIYVQWIARLLRLKGKDPKTSQKRVMARKGKKAK